MIYNDYVKNMTGYIYGKNSVIFQTLMAGEKISGLVKASLKKKGYVYRIGDKKKLLAECKKCEQVATENVEEQDIVNLS